MSTTHRDQALDALLHPFAEGLLRWPQAGNALFLRAREGAALHALGVRGMVEGITPQVKHQEDRGASDEQEQDAEDQGEGHDSPTVAKTRGAAVPGARRSAT